MDKFFGKFLFLLFISVTLLVGQGLDDNNDAKKLYNEGISLLKGGNFSGGFSKFEEASKLVQDYRLDFRMGEAKRKQKKYEESINHYNAAIAKNADYYPSYFYLAGAYYALGEFDKAKEYYDKTISLSNNKKVVKIAKKNIRKIDEKLAHPLVVKGNQLLNSRKYDAAIAKFSEALKLAPSDAANIGLAEAYFEKGNYSKSVEYSHLVLAKKNKKLMGAAYYYIGKSKKASGQTEEAKTNFKKGLKYKNWKKLCKYELDNFS